MLLNCCGARGRSAPVIADLNYHAGAETFRAPGDNPISGIDVANDFNELTSSESGNDADLLRF